MVFIYINVHTEGPKYQITVHCLKPTETFTNPTEHCPGFPPGTAWLSYILSFKLYYLTVLPKFRAGLIQVLGDTFST
jgi:hypothetical protein